MSTVMNIVNPALTPTPPPTRTVAVETPAFTGFVHRILRALGRRVGLGADIEGLPDLLALETEVQAVTRAAVRRLRTEHGYSWTDIGARAGITRQAAQQRWGGDR